MRIRYVARILITISLFLFMQGCILWQRPFIRPIPVFIEDRHIEVEVIDNKIVIRIQTRRNPERYWEGARIAIWDGMGGGNMVFGGVNNYVDGDMLIIEVATSRFTEWTVGINLMEVGITGPRKNEVYRYRPSEFIWLIEEPRSVN